MHSWNPFQLLICILFASWIVPATQALNGGERLSAELSKKLIESTFLRVAPNNRVHRRYGGLGHTLGFSFRLNSPLTENAQDCPSVPESVLSIIWEAGLLWYVWILPPPTLHLPGQTARHRQGDASAVSRCAEINYVFNQLTTPFRAATKAFGVRQSNPPTMWQPITNCDGISWEHDDSLSNEAEWMMLLQGLGH